MTRTEAMQSALIRWLDTNRAQIDAMRRGEKLALEVICQSGGGAVRSPGARGRPAPLGADGAAPRW